VQVWASGGGWRRGESKTEGMSWGVKTVANALTAIATQMNLELFDRDKIDVIWGCKVARD